MFCTLHAATNIRVQCHPYSVTAAKSMHYLVTSMLMLQAFASANGASAHIYLQCLRKRLLPHFHSKIYLCIHTKPGIQSNSTAP